MGRQFKQIIEEAGEFSMQQREQTIRERMTLNLKEFAGKVAAFNKLGEALYGGGNFSKLAEDLEEIATHAEAYTLRETEDSPFDQVTIKRNMKELRGYTGEFKKVASEARSLQERMTALYEDSGRVLGRYFEIKEYGSPDGMSELEPKSEEEKIVNNNPGLREGEKPAFCPKCKHRILPGSKQCPNCGHIIKETKICEGCGKPMEQCECMKEGGLGSPATSNTRRTKKIFQTLKQNEGETKCPGCDNPMSQCDCPGHVHEGRIIDKEAYLPTGVTESKSMKLKSLMEEVSINDDYPKDDWVKLDVPKLRIDVAEEFEKDLKKKKFNVRRFDWKERVGHRQTFCEFFAKKDDFNEVNDYAVRTYPQFDENSKLEKE